MEFDSVFRNNLVFTPTDDQNELISALENFVFDDEVKVFVLQGYAGTGKTTMMSALINTLPRFGYYTTLLAPTGRAAKVLSRFSHKKAFTIHKRIYFSNHDESNFTFKLKNNKSTRVVFIVDESSMIGTENTGMYGRNLLEDLMTYIFEGKDCKVIFIGDTAQLPPVGQELSHALDSDFLQRTYNCRTEKFRLTQVVRQALLSGILKNASNIRYRLYKNNFSLPIFKLSGAEDVHKIGSEDFEEHLRQTYKEYGQQEVVVICKSNYQANALNNLIRYRILERESLIEGGDRLMVVKNNYFWIDDSSEIGFVANGDIFRINRVIAYTDKFDFRFADVAIVFNDYEQEGEIEVKILLDTLESKGASLESDKGKALYNNIFEYYYKQCHSKARAWKSTYNDPYFQALQVKFASCLTCHKSQGGGWDAVFVFQSLICQDGPDKEYFRWLYTAITRAKQQLYLVNFTDDFFKDLQD